MNLLGITVLVTGIASLSVGVRAEVVGGDDERIPSSSRQAELIHLLKHDCGACHGMQLKGGLGPPLRAADLSAKSESALVSTVLAGRAGTPMPPWRGLLTAAEAWWLVRYLREAKL